MNQADHFVTWFLLVASFYTLFFAYIRGSSDSIFFFFIGMIAVFFCIGELGKHWKIKGFA